MALFWTVEQIPIWFRERSLEGIAPSHCPSSIFRSEETRELILVRSRLGNWNWNLCGSWKNSRMSNGIFRMEVQLKVEFQNLLNGRSSASQTSCPFSRTTIPASSDHYCS